MVAQGKLAPGTARAQRTGRQNRPTVSPVVSPSAPAPLASPAPPNEAPAQPKRNNKKAPIDNDNDPRYVPSQGSKNHYKGQCRPCRNNQTPEGCSKGVSCNYCHCWHGDEKFVEMVVCSAMAHARRAMDKDCCASRKEVQNNVLVPVMLMESQASPTQQHVADQQILPSEPFPTPPLMQGLAEDSRRTFGKPPNQLEIGCASFAVQPSQVSGSHFQFQVLQMQLVSVTVIPTHAAETSQHAAMQQIPAQHMREGEPLQVLQTDGPTLQHLQDMQTRVMMSQDAPRYDRQGEGQRVQVKRRPLRHAGPVAAGFPWIQNVQHCGNGDMRQQPQKCQMEPGVHMNKLVHSFWPGCASQSTEELMQTLREALPAYYDE